MPDEDCVKGCEKIAALAKDITARDLVFTISGSGSILIFERNFLLVRM